jgi:hypothetical protein
MKSSIQKGGTISTPITDKGLNDIYEKYQNLKSKNKINDFIKYLDNNNKTEMSKILTSQEKILKLQEANEKKQKKMIEYIQNKLKRKENEMLINTIYSFRSKREIVEIIDKNQPLEIKYGNNSWVMGLRRPLDFNGVRFSYINLRDAKNPYWQLVKDKGPIDVETIKHPNTSQTDFSKNQYLMRSLSNLGIKMDTTMSQINTNISVLDFKIARRERFTSI